MMDKIALNEVEYVELPFMRQLERLGWKTNYGKLKQGKEWIEPGKFDPAYTHREGFNEVYLEKNLRKAMLRINPWLEEDQLSPLIHELSTPNLTGGLLENNHYVFDKLLEGSSAENRKTGRPEAVKFIDFANVDRNEFLAISQFKVTIPGTEKHIIPDIVLFVNGLPLVLVECKSSFVNGAIEEAFEQLLRYQKRRGEEKEGNEKLFWYNQLLVATCRQKCRYSSITGEFEHFVEWKDPYPCGLEDIDTEGSGSVTSQHIFIQGVLARANFLDIIHSFILYQELTKGKYIKVVPRYQQYRTVCKITKGLKSKKSQKEKGGIVWHTQGSGKSLTMMMLVRKMYHDTELAQYKTVFVTDRIDLQRQLKGTSKDVGYTTKIASKIAKLKELLKTDTPDLVMGMIHKFQEHEMMQEFPVLNKSERILVLIDEAHRSQYKFLGANLAKSLPNAVKIAFTGTPIDKTEVTFGDYIDKYSIRQAVEDEVTVEIIYEGRTHSADISDRDAMNRRFEDVFQSADEETKKSVLGRYTWRAYLESEETIKEKAEDMLRHYLAHIFSNGFKAQVVAVSRYAAIMYKKAFDTLLSDKQWMEKYVASLKNDTQLKIDKDQLMRLRAEVVISGTPNDKPEFSEFTDEDKHEQIIDSFKLPFGKKSKEGISGDVGILIVQSMLITGFDAPIEQVMYLDDVIKEHNLLQAIARVNRIEKNKKAGYVVDYVGVAKHLREALSNFEKRDVDEILKVVKDESKDIDDLIHNRSELINFFKKYDISDLEDIDACIDVLADDETRDDFIILLRKFMSSMDRVLPKVEALRFVNDLKKFSFISQSARERYRDDKFSLRDASKKIRDIVDDYLISKGVDPKIPPIPILSDQFKARIRKERSPRAKAEELKSAITEHISRHREEDPELYERFAEKLEKLLKEYKDNWESLAKELESLLDGIKEGREAEENFGLDRKTEMPFLGLLKKEVFGVKSISQLKEEQVDLLVQVTKDILERVNKDTKLVDFWNNIPAQRKLKGFIASHLLTAFNANSDIFNNRTSISQKVLELAFHIEQRGSNDWD